VVDDEESIRTVLRETLIQHGYRVLMASDGAEATVMFARNLAEVKMVITDLDMPFMDGVALLKVVKRMKPDVLAIVSTGMASTRTSRERAAELEMLGVETILKKPYTAASILTAVHKSICG
jgi:DNA-binding NtrC family response regulator